MAECEQPAQPETDFIFTGAAGQYGIGGCDTPIGCMALRHGNPATSKTSRRADLCAIKVHPQQNCAAGPVFL
jgi:hypothetical protein